MKIALVLLFAGFALVGCSTNQGGLAENSSTDASGTVASDNGSLPRAHSYNRSLGTPLRGANGSDRR